MPVREGEQSSIGFQPVPRDHSAWPCEIGNEVRVGRRSIGAGHRLEAYTILLLGLVDPVPQAPILRGQAGPVTAAARRR